MIPDTPPDAKIFPGTLRDSAATAEAELGGGLHDGPLELGAFEPLLEAFGDGQRHGNGLPTYDLAGLIVHQTTGVHEPGGPGEIHLRDRGLAVDENAVVQLREVLKARTHAGCMVVFSGSLPPGLEPDLLGALLDESVAAGARVVVDSSGAAFRTTVPIALPGGRRTVKAALVVVVALAAAWGAWEIVRRGASALPGLRRTPVVAVMPLTNLTGEESHDATAAGIAEVVVGSLSAIDGVQVLSRSSTAAYRDRKDDLPGVARELDASYLLDGVLQRSEDELRVSLSLIHVPSNVVRWSASYDGAFPRLFDLQSRVAVEVAHAGPCLASLTSALPFLERWVEALGSNAGILFEAPADLELVYRHLREIFVVTDEEDQEFFFRYYDPRVLRAFLPTCTSDELRQFFGPIARWIAEDEKHEGYCVYECRDGALHESALKS